MLHPGFVRPGIVVGVGAEFKSDKISLDAVVVVKKSFRHQAHQVLQLLLIFVMSSLELQLLARIMQKVIHAGVILLPLARIKRRAVKSQVSDRRGCL
jgi:hypothetical protein